MCGIAGFWASASGPRGPVADRLLAAMRDTLVHRGPDGAGSWTDPDSGIALAQRRLAIIDLSDAGRQPMASASGRYVIVYNGEIYNHPALRAELEAQGAAPAWRGRSDTETLLALVDHLGVEAALQRLAGMFAFALWDRRDRALYLARDRMGEKPLYYAQTAKGVLFGSELKALLAFPGFEPQVDRAAVAAYLRFGYVPHPHSIYRGVCKLPAAHWLRFDAAAGSAAEARPYWSFGAVCEAGAAAPDQRDFQMLAADTETLLGDVVESQMISDVPLGVFLSGGIDSSLLASLMQARASRPVRTFSIGFSEARFNEADRAQAIAAHLGTDHTELVVRDADALALVPQLPRIYDEPFADSSQLPTILLSRMTRAHVTVALSGDGGDEIFGGYNRYLFGPALWKRLGWLPKALRQGLASTVAAGAVTDGRGADRLARLAARAGLPITTFDKLSKFTAAVARADSEDDLYREVVATFPEPGAYASGGEEAPSLLDSTRGLPRGGSSAERWMAADALTYLPDDILVKVDRATMSASLESRAPFLDVRTVEHASRLPLSAKIAGGTGKRILRAILSRQVPAALIAAPKRGFAVPLDDWLRGGLAEWAGDLLSPSSLDRCGLVDTGMVTELWSRHRAGRGNLGQRLWTILMLVEWSNTQRDRLPSPGSMGNAA